MTKYREISHENVRKLAISRQHLDAQERPSFIELFRDLGCVQLDPIRHVARTHELVLWSRLGNYDVAEFEAFRWQKRAVFEYWAHAASMVLTEEMPVHEYHMRMSRDPKSSSWARRREEWFVNNKEVLDPLSKHILSVLADGPKLSRDIEGARAQKSRWYNGRLAPRVLDYHWTRGEVMVYGRSGNQRIWSLAEDFLPDWTPREVWSPVELTTFSAQKAIRALGVATEKQIKRHYTRNVYPDLKSVLKKLTSEGILQKVVVTKQGEVLPGEWYLHQEDVQLLDEIESGNWNGRTTLLSPFDNLICDRDRTELLWDFYYRIEIYVPKAKRQFGYYVLPVLEDDKLVGRVDAQMDRKANTLRVDNLYLEDKIKATKKRSRQITKSIKQLAQFLEAKDIQWGKMPTGWQ